MKKEIFNIVLKRDINQIVSYLEKELDEQIINKNLEGKAELQVNIEVIFHW